MKKLEKSQVQEIVNCMYLKAFTAGDYVIKEGDGGKEMYVLAGGSIFYPLDILVEQPFLYNKASPGNLKGNLGKSSLFNQYQIISRLPIMLKTFPRAPGDIIKTFISGHSLNSF